jgi:predicted kinase
MFDQPETARLPADAYAPEVTARLYGLLVEKARHIVAAGHAAIVDAVHARPEERAAVAAVARKTGVRFQGLFLHAPLDVRLRRVGARRADASDADAAIAREQESYALGALDWTRIDASGTPDETFARAKAVLETLA